MGKKAPVQMDRSNRLFGFVGHTSLSLEGWIGRHSRLFACVWTVEGLNSVGDQLPGLAYLAIFLVALLYQRALDGYLAPLGPILIMYLAYSTEELDIESVGIIPDFHDSPGKWFLL